MKTIHTICLFILTIAVYLLLAPAQCPNGVDPFVNVRREGFAVKRRKDSRRKRTTSKKKKRTTKRKLSKKKTKPTKRSLKK